MKIHAVANSVRSILDMEVPLIETVNMLVSLIIAESWTHGWDESLNIEDLTDEEYRNIHMWVVLNRWTYDNVKMLRTDMVQVFAGLSDRAARHLS